MEENLCTCKLPTKNAVSFFTKCFYFTSFLRSIVGSSFCAWLYFLVHLTFISSPFLVPFDFISPSAFWLLFPCASLAACRHASSLSASRKRPTGRANLFLQFIRWFLMYEFLGLWPPKLKETVLKKLIGGSLSHTFWLNITFEAGVVRQRCFPTKCDKHLSNMLKLQAY